MGRVASALPFESVGPKSQARTASSQAVKGVDDYSTVGVGVSLIVSLGGINDSDDEEDPTYYTEYASHNINISGFQTKEHAEQGALRHFMEDYIGRGEPDGTEIHRMMVVTTEGDLSLVCGPCLQYMRSIAHYIRQDPDDIMYWAARPSYFSVEEVAESVPIEKGEDAVWEFREGKVGDFLSETYAEGVMQTKKQE